MYCGCSTIYDQIFNMVLFILSAKIQIIKALFVLMIKSSDDILSTSHCQLLNEVRQESLINGKGIVIMIRNEIKILFCSYSATLFIFFEAKIRACLKTD